MTTTKHELYVALCREAGSYDEPPGTTPEQWYEMCDHNIGYELYQALASAAAPSEGIVLARRATHGA